MNDLFAYVASAALPVAVVLLVLGLTARGVIWAQIDDPRWQRLARQYLEPLSTWSVGAFIAYALTLTAAGDAAAGSLAIALVLAVAAAVLRIENDEAPRGEDAVASAPVASGSVTEPYEAEPAAPGGLWARRES